MSRITYDVECLYKGEYGQPDEWKTWMADHPYDPAMNLLKQGEKLAKEKDCLFKAVRLVRVSRDII